MKKRLFIVISLIFSLSALAQNNTEISIFWTEFKNSVIINDTLKLATMMHFSENNGLIGKGRNEFYNNINSIFDKRTIEIMNNIDNLTKTERNTYYFVGSGAYKFFYFKKIDKKYKLFSVVYYD